MGLQVLKYSSVFESLITLFYYLCNLVRRRRRTQEFIPEEEEELELQPLLLEELVEEILSWLPVKSLLRFRSVSKSWNSLVSDSRFVKLHLHHSSSRVNADFSHARFLTTCYFPDPNRSYISYRYQPYISYRSVTSLLESDHSAKSTDCISKYNLVGTCNGLVCLSYEFQCRDRFFRRFCFWNPATRSMSQCSPPMSQCSPRLISSGYFGFGYDCSSDTYKVVNVVSPEKTTVNVYNMGDHRWWRVQVLPLHRLRLIPPAVYASNTVNWLASRQPKNTDPYKIVSFHLEKQKYAQLSLPYGPPPRDKYNHFFPVLGVLRGCLCISEYNKRTGDFVVWQMKEFGIHQSWTRLFSINGSEKISPQHCFAMCMSDSGDALLLSVSPTSQGVLYTLRDNKLQGKRIAFEIDGCYAENYIESLVSPC